MKARLSIKVLIFLVTVWFSEGLTWNTEMRSVVCCQGKTQSLIWNYTKGENERVTGLHWFFNEKTLVCLESETKGFIVADLYDGRVERNGTAGILLKNVSLNDSGEYTLYVKLEEEKKRNVQGINLTVVEPPPNQCKPIIKKEHSKGIVSCFTSCERSPLSIEWIINGTKIPGVIGPYLVVDPLWASKQPICCLCDFKCVDDYQFKFCTPNHFSFTEDTNCMVFTPILISLIVTLILLITVVIACVILNRRRCRLCHNHHYARTQDTERQCEVPLSVAVKLKHSNTVVQCNEDRQKVPGISTTTDYSLQDSNQQEPFENKSSIDTDLFQRILHSNTASRKELQASRKEETVPMFPKDQQPHADVNDVQVPEETSLMLPNNQDPHADVNVQEPEKPFPILGTAQEMDADLKSDQIEETFSTMLEKLQSIQASLQHIQEQDDADRFETSESEDASSEPLVHHD